MPELPEVETIRQTLIPHFVGRVILNVWILDAHLIRTPVAPESFGAALTGQRVRAVDRRGKYLLVRLSGGNTWVIHLRMSGRLAWHPEPPAPESARFLRLRLELDDGSVLDFHDMRRLATFYLVDSAGLGAPAGLRELGPEALDEDAFTPSALAASCRDRTVTIKGLLLDQRVVAGLGNIYVDEALHRARLHPERQSGSLRTPEIRRLHAAIRAVLQDGIEHLGVSFSLYRDAEGNPGFMSSYLRVYGRAGEPCDTCGTVIVRNRVAGRGSAWCPRCQREPRTKVARVRGAARARVSRDAAGRP